MASTLSGTTSFTLDIDDIIEEAMIPLGGQHESGIEMGQARRALNLILIEMQNKNIPLNKLSFETLALIQGQDTYVLDTSWVDIQELSVKTDTDRCSHSSG